MTLCNNFQRKWGVGVFSEVGVFSRGYGTDLFVMLLSVNNDYQCRLLLALIMDNRVRIAGLEMPVSCYS